MHADHYFTIGTDHISAGTPCEDYALSGTLRSGAVFGVVADGCSGANANTDVGARAIAWAFQRALREREAEPGQWFDPGFSELLLDIFNHHQYTGCGLDYQATVVGVVGTPEAASVYVHGDGAVIVRYADGALRLIQLAWWENAPFYINYKLHPQALDDFMLRFADGVIEPFLQTTTAFRQSAGELIIDSPQVKRFSMSEQFEGHVLQFRPAEEGIVSIAVLTDGIEKIGTLAPVAVATELMAFKNFEGSFVKRRVMKALKELAKVGAVPRDDLAVATILFPAKV